MENVIYNELVGRGFDVDVGVVEIFEVNEKGSGVKKQIEIDFVATMADRRFYIQSALSIADPDKRVQEERPLAKVVDAFTKIILVDGKKAPRRNESGYLVMGVIDFLLDPSLVQ